MNSAPSINEDTILGFVQRHAAQAVSVDYDQAQQTAQRVAALGFTGGGNVRLVQFLEDFRPDPKLKAYYEEHYPSCFFLTWRGLRRVLSTLKLWCDLPQHYAGSVPGEQIPWLEAFDRRPEDTPTVHDMMAILETGRANSEDRLSTEIIIRHHSRGLWPTDEIYKGDQWTSGQLDWIRRFHQNTIIAAGRVGSEPHRVGEILEQAIRDFVNSFMVVAPPGAFHTTEDWITRTQKLADRSVRATQIVNDPLVIRPVKHGALVVAAWGDEANELNALVNQLNLT